MAALAPTSATIIDASALAVQPSLASNFANASWVMKNRYTAFDWAPASNPADPAATR